MINLSQFQTRGSPEASLKRSHGHLNISPINWVHFGLKWCYLWSCVVSLSRHNGLGIFILVLGCLQVSVFLPS
ncbi:hypothetical protein BUALT_Bualt13G0108000 [Buddleja alternifolia]|uniref:Uncharacterized protein n=1 Tax=Buddleja alternifolia TaxID=168488 RepID=A0AAV6WN70_9LAMI|nr:hypothetical protein BUALT_Bualt13G0108000 [Buddleja alternifolia]